MNNQIEKIEAWLKQEYDGLLNKYHTLNAEYCETFDADYPVASDKEGDLEAIDGQMHDLSVRMRQIARMKDFVQSLGFKSTLLEYLNNTYPWVKQ